MGSGSNTVESVPEPGSSGLLTVWVSCGALCVGTTPENSWLRNDMEK